MFRAEDIDNGIKHLQRKIGLPENFLTDIYEEEDWSFIIKLHALLENVCTSLLVYHFNEPKLVDVLSKLELSDSEKGKIAFLKALELIGIEERRVIISLSELRNKLVHDVTEYSIDLKKYIQSLDKNQIKSFAVSFSPLETRGRKIEESGIFPESDDENWKRQISIQNVLQRAIENPKDHIWHGVYHVLIDIVDSHYYSNYLQSLKEPKFPPLS